MGYLRGFKETVKKAYKQSAFDLVLSSRQQWLLQLFDHQSLKCRIIENDTYNVIVKMEEGETRELAKLQIQCMYPAALQAKVVPFLEKYDSEELKGIEPSTRFEERNHIKNKNLYPIAMDHGDITLILLNGYKIKGQLSTFTKYELMLSLEPKLPIIILRHAIFKAYDASGIDILKEAQQGLKSWQKSRFWIEGENRNS